MKFDAKLVILLIAAVAVSATGSAFLTSWYFVTRGACEPGAGGGVASAQSAPFDPGLVWDAGEFTVNLVTNSSVPRYLKTSMSFRANTKAAVAELERRRVQVQDRVITTLRLTEVSALQKAEGVELLKQRLIDGVNELLGSPAARVQDVYLSELIIQ